MNDFGTFQAIEQLIRQDEILAEKLRSVVTEQKPEMICPYVMITYDNTILDLPCFIQKALLRISITIFSDYNGEQEIQDLLTRLDYILDGTAVEVQPRVIEARASAIFKRIAQTIEKDKARSFRTGNLCYQIKIKINRE